MAQNKRAELGTSSLSTKTDIDEKAAKIIKLIKTSNLRKKGVINPTKSEIIELVEDFHKQYRSLYALHDDLIEKVTFRENDDDVEEEDSYFSADERSISSGPGRDHIRKKSGEIYLILKNTNAEILELKNKLASMTEEKEALNLKYENAIEGMKIGAAVSQSKLQESEKIIEVLRIEAERIEWEKNKSFDEISKLKKKYAKRDKKLETEISRLKLEGENLRKEKRDIQEQIEGKDTDIKSLGDENLKLQARVEELEKVTKWERKLEREMSSLKLEEENLRNEKLDLQEQIHGKDIEIKNLGGEILKLQARIEELEKVSQERDQLLALVKKLNENQREWHSKMDKADQELSDFRNQTIDLNETIDDMATDLRDAQETKSDFENRVKDLEQKVEFVTSEKVQLEMQMEKKIKEAELLKVENEKLLYRISKLEKLEEKRGGELSAIQENLKGLENNSSIKIKSSEEEVKKLQEKMKQNLKILERKMDETAAGFCKEFEDKVRILGRRIRVAEQLHMENKEIYTKTKQKYEKEHEGYKDMIETREVAVKMMRNISVTTNEIVDKSAAAAKKFNEKSESFLNRIAKASCEVLFAKDWIKRKNEAIESFQEDADELVLGMEKKESEISVFRGRIRKLENKIKELEN